jgi:predicted Zn-dependent peptidase
MKYIKFSDYIYILANNLTDRKKTEIEIIWTAGGSYFEKKQDSGRKHLMEHCIVSRTKDMNFQEFQDFQFRENIMFNAYTGPATMGVEASGHYSDFEKILDLSLETAFMPTFDQAILDQEKEIVLREISERRGDPNYQLHYQVMNQVFTKDSYENHETLGSSEQVKKGELKDFDRLHLENLSTSPVIICCYGGGVDIDLIQKKLDQIVAQKDLLQVKKMLQKENKKPINFKIQSKFKNFRKKAIVSELAHAHCEINLYIPFQKNFQNEAITRVFEELYFKYHGKVYDRLRNQLGLIYSMYGAFQSSVDCLYLNLACEKQHIKTIISEIQSIFSNFEKNFEETKLQELKNTIIKKIEITQDNPYSSINLLRNSLTNYNQIETLESYQNKLANVTRLDIKKIYQEIQSNLSNSKLVLVSKNSEIKNIIEKIKI